MEELRNLCYEMFDSVRAALRDPTGAAVVNQDQREISRSLISCMQAGFLHVQT